MLVPFSHKDPRKWKTYEMHEYRNAFSEETMNKVEQFKYDNNFHNWEDPKVLKYFTKSTKNNIFPQSSLFKLIKLLILLNTHCSLDARITVWCNGY